MGNKTGKKGKVRKGKEGPLFTLKNNLKIEELF